MLLEITQGDIDLAKLPRKAGVSRGECCPIANALRRYGYNGVSVGPWTIGYRENGRFNQVCLTNELRQYMLDADNSGDNVPPASFRLELRESL